MEVRKSLSFIGILLGMVSSVLMQTIVATVLPVISNELGQKGLYGWVFSSYMIASVVTIPLFSKLSDLYGRKRFYLWGMVLFLAGSLFSGFSQSMTQLILCRVIQGIGAGAIAPSAIAMISELYEPDVRVKMLGLLSAFQVVATIIGPVFGGVITEIYSWRWTFFINLPIGLLAFAMIKMNYWDIKRDLDLKQKKMDYIGSMTLGISTVLFIFFLQQLGTRGIGAMQLAVLLFAIMIFAIFLMQERKHANPILSLDLLKIREIRISLISIFILGSITYSVIAILPLYGQHAMSEPLDGAKLLIVFSAGFGGGGIVSGKLPKLFKLVQIISGSWLLTIMAFLSLILMNGYSVHESIQLGFIFLMGIGLGLNLPIFLGLSQNAAPHTEQAVTGGMVQISRNIGGAVSIPLFANMIIFHETNNTEFASFFYVFTLLAMMAFAGLLFGLRLKK